MGEIHTVEVSQWILGFWQSSIHHGSILGFKDKSSMRERNEVVSEARARRRTWWSWTRTSSLWCPPIVHRVGRKGYFVLRGSISPLGTR
jgi:hypothetical protein